MAAISISWSGFLWTWEKINKQKISNVPLKKSRILKKVWRKKLVSAQMKPCVSNIAETSEVVWSKVISYKKLHIITGKPIILIQQALVTHHGWHGCPLIHTHLPSSKSDAEPRQYSITSWNRMQCQLSPSHVPYVKQSKPKQTVLH